MHLPSVLAKDHTPTVCHVCEESEGEGVRRVKAKEKTGWISTAGAPTYIMAMGGVASVNVTRGESATLAVWPREPLRRLTANNGMRVCRRTGVQSRQVGNRQRLRHYVVGPASCMVR